LLKNKNLKKLISFSFFLTCFSFSQVKPNIDAVAKFEDIIDSIPQAKLDWEYLLENGIKGKQYLRDFGCLILRDWVALISHEFGHAVAAKLLINSKYPVKVHLGTGPEKTKIISVGGQAVKIHSILPVKGWTEVPKSASRWKNVLIALAGPICGALAYYFMSLSKLAWNQSGKKENFDKSIFVKALFDFDIYKELIKNLIPKGTNDGAHILREFFPQIDTNSSGWNLIAGLTQIIVKSFAKKGVFNLAANYEYRNLADSPEKAVLKEKFKHKIGAQNSIKSINRFLMSFSNNSAGTLKNLITKKKFGLNDIDITPMDILNLAYNLATSPGKIKEFYGN